MFELGFLSLANVMNQRARGTHGRALPEEAEAVERCSAELLTKNARRVIGIEEPVFHGGPGNTVQRLDAFFELFRKKHLARRKMLHVQQ